MNKKVTLRGSWRKLASKEYFPKNEKKKGEEGRESNIFDKGGKKKLSNPAKGKVEGEPG